ncbi:MAG TPA: DUF2802 domain-containing protein [Steroidobacteraceae bacterium]|nr:DUF2802 domain-containing protein [Steroidobacteraceae bacterium]
MSPVLPTENVLWLVAGGALSALALVALVGMLLLSRRVQGLEILLRSELAKAREELAQVAAQGLRVANQQRANDAQIRQLADRQGRVELRGDGRPFEQAIEMLRAGATRSDVVARLGLSESEAALLVLLHGARGGGSDQA